MCAPPLLKLRISAGNSLLSLEAPEIVALVGWVTSGPDQISRQLLNELPSHFVQIFMVPSAC